MNRIRLQLLASTALVVFIAPTFISPVQAQQAPSGEIRGHVTDEMGATIPRARVFVRRIDSDDETIRLIANTDTGGNFAISLPEGGYEVLIASRGFASELKVVPVWHSKTRKEAFKLKALGCDFPGVNCDTFK